MAETMELTEQSTKDEVNEYVEQVVEEVKADRAGEKTDAQIISDTVEQTPVAEKKASDEKPAKAPKAKAEKAAKAVEEAGEESAVEWLDDDLKAEVSAYGIEESELADFASREELERALRLFDKSALEAGRKALADSEGKEPTRNEKGQFVAKKVEDGVLLTKETPKAELAEHGIPVKEGRYEVKLSKDVYDDAVVDEFTQLRDHYESRLEVLERQLQEMGSRFEEADAVAEEQRFDSLVDSLDHSDLFGKTGKETAEQLQRREDLLVQAKALQMGLAQLGRPTDLNESLVSRAARMVFAEDFFKKELKNRTRKISRQSNGRQGGGATRPQDPREDPRDEADRLYKELSQA